MPKDYIPSNDHEFLTWAQNFIKVAEEFQPETGMTPTQIQELADEVAAYANDLGTSDTKDYEALAAKNQKNVSHDRTEKALRQAARLFKAQPAMPEAALIGMGLSVPSGERTRQEAQMPTHLFGELQSDGKVHLEWDAGGNSYGVTYIIERRKGAGTIGEFIIVGTSTRRSFVYAGEDAAEPAMYRVRAQRGDTMSAYSNTANIGF